MNPRDFLPPWTPKLQVDIVVAAHDDIGEHEDPPGSNRGAYPDLVNAEFGSPLGSYWCANAVGHWWKKAGAQIPPDNVGNCERWHQFATRTGTLCHAPEAGYAVLYGGDDGKANHMSVVEQVVGDRAIDIGGNTTLTPGFDRNGWIVQQKDVNKSRLLGYVRPVREGEMFP